jgi:hypothetical protein
MILDPSKGNAFILIFSAYSIAFLAALWLSLIVWTSIDIRHRTRYPLVRLLTILGAAVRFVQGTLILLFLRPQSTLEEEALLFSIEERSPCQECGKQVEIYTKLCLHCLLNNRLAWNRLLSLTLDS